jgi:hypothetical protein
MFILLVTIDAYSICGYFIDGYWWLFNLSLGLTTKVRACKSVGQKEARESHFMIPGVQKNVKE